MSAAAILYHAASILNEALLARNVTNDQIVANIRKPMLFTYGRKDSIVLKTMHDHMFGLVERASARMSVYDEAGHEPFWEAPDRFHRELKRFRDSA